MNYNAMKELSNKLQSELKDPQTTDESQSESPTEESNQETSFKEKAAVSPPVNSEDSRQEDAKIVQIENILTQQQEALNRLLGEVAAQTAQLTSLKLLINGLPSVEGRQPDDSAHNNAVQNLIAEVSILKDAVQRQEKANTDILRDSKNFQAGIKTRMQDELDQYHRLHAQNVYAPILTEIAGLYISTQRILDSAEDGHLKEQLKNALLDSLAELLEDNGVTIARTEVGKARSLKLCKTRKTIATGDESLKGKVARSYNPSFALGNQILQKEIVDTYIFEPAMVSTDENAKTAGQLTDTIDDDTTSEAAMLPDPSTGQAELSEETDKQE